MQYVDSFCLKYVIDRDMVLIYLIALAVNQTDTQVMLTMMNGRNCRRKVPGCVPHDIGDPGEFKPKPGQEILENTFSRRGSFL